MSHTGYRTYECPLPEECHTEIVFMQKELKLRALTQTRQRLTNQQLRRHESKLHKLLDGGVKEDRHRPKLSS
jgi:hypothetical protein